MPLVLVYGTLKRGLHNHKVYLSPLQPVFDGVVRIPAKMYTNGRYPMLIPDPELNSFFIEIYEVTPQKRTELDSLEFPFNYFRTTITFDEFSQPVEVYYYKEQVPPESFYPFIGENWKPTEDW